MTITHSPHTAGRAESRRTRQTEKGSVGVRTNGFGIRSIWHLNLTKTLADVEEARVKSKVRKEKWLARQDRTRALLEGRPS